MLGAVRLWWNWQTRYFEVVVPQGVQVQVLLCAPFLQFDWFREARITVWRKNHGLVAAEDQIRAKHFWARACFSLTRFSISSAQSAGPPGEPCHSCGRALDDDGKAMPIMRGGPHVFSGASQQSRRCGDGREGLPHSQPFKAKGLLHAQPRGASDVAILFGNGYIPMCAT